MSSEWRTVDLGSICRFQAGSAFKPEFQGAVSGDFPFVKVSDMNLYGNEFVIRCANNYVTEAQRIEMGAKLHPSGATIFAKIGVALQSNRRRFLVMPTIIDNNMMSATPDTSYVSPRFLYFLLTTLDFNTISAGTALPYLNVSDLRKITVAIPDFATQASIAEFLGALDDRITLLRETNATLEAIAQALFKSWFVDFDPVHAKQQGRAPEGMDEATATLFPDSFAESELGLVPKGWRVGKLEELLVLQRGFDLPSSDRIPGNYPIIAASGPAGTHKTAMAKAPGVVTGRSGVLGRVFLELEDYWPLNTTLWVKEFRAASPCYGYEVLSLLDFASFNAGSAVPTLNRNHVHSLPYLIPSRACIDAYESVAMKLHARVRENQHQAQTLATLRDTLLPRLISGQLRLPVAGAVLDEALT